SVELPEKEADYPEITMFGKSLPASALVARHVKGLSVTHLQFSVSKPDDRPIAWLNDASDITLAHCTVSVVGALPPFLSISGKDSANIHLDDNNDTQSQLAPNVPHDAVRSK